MKSKNKGVTKSYNSKGSKFIVITHWHLLVRTNGGVQHSLHLLEEGD